MMTTTFRGDRVDTPIASSSFMTMRCQRIRRRRGVEIQRRGDRRCVTDVSMMAIVDDRAERGGEASTNDGGALRGRTTRKRARREGDGVRETQTKKTKPTTRETTRGSKRDEKTTEREEELVCAENLTRGDGAYRSRGRIATVLVAF